MESRIQSLTLDLTTISGHASMRFGGLSAPSSTDGRSDVRPHACRTGCCGAWKPGGVAHFGFRLTRPDDIEQARDAVRAAGGAIRETGEFIPGEPYVFFSDPDGYEVEIWYELPTPVDPEV